MKSLGWTGILLAAGLAGCAHPAPPPPPPPPAPVGHIYQTLVQVPPAPRWVHIKPEDQEQLQLAFNVIGLKSALMVGALSCQQQDRYDSFVQANQPHILADQHMMDTYFRRIGGRAGQTQEDNFVTLLANNQSVGGIGQGKIFCLNNQAEFDKVATLTTPDQLDAFVTDQSPEPIVEPTVETVVTPVKKTHHYIKHVASTKPAVTKPAASTAKPAVTPAAASPATTATHS